MDPARNDHPDEGTIHAWLDGAFDAPTAEAIEAHVASCPSCTERVAEARGLIAGASRVVSALDDVPSGVTPAWGRAPAPALPSRGSSTWRRLRVTPKRAAIAATILVALGVTLTRQRIAPEAELATSKVATTSAPAAAPVLPHDALLDSAVKRNVEAANPPRAIRAAPGPEVAVPLASERAPAVLADSTARSRVAVAREAIRAQADSSRVLADRATVVGSAIAGAAPVASEVERREMAASRKADALTQAVPARKALALRPVPAAAECYRVESANGTPATWGTVTLPFVVALDTVGHLGRVSGADGSSDTQAIWSRAGDDSLTFKLRRLGYTGTLTLGGAGDVRPGVMRSAPVQQQLSELVVTGVAAESGRAAEKRPAIRGRTAPAAAPSSAPAAAPSSARAAAAPAENAGAPATAVVARRVSCQS
jgi:hypothetical protein